MESLQLDLRSPSDGNFADFVADPDDGLIDWAGDVPDGSAGQLSVLPFEIHFKSAPCAEAFNAAVLPGGWGGGEQVNEETGVVFGERLMALQEGLD